jgi:hypothetical protein
VSVFVARWRRTTFDTDSFVCLPSWCPFGALRYRLGRRDGPRVLESSAGGLVDDLGGIGTHEAVVVVVHQKPNLRHSSVHQPSNPCHLSIFMRCCRRLGANALSSLKNSRSAGPASTCVQAIALGITGLLAFLLRRAVLHALWLGVKVCLPLWPASLLAPKSHVAHNTTTAAIPRFIFFKGLDSA